MQQHKLIQNSELISIKVKKSLNFPIFLFNIFRKSDKQIQKRKKNENNILHLCTHRIKITYILHFSIKIKLT